MENLNDVIEEFEMEREGTEYQVRGYPNLIERVKGDSIKDALFNYMASDRFNPDAYHVCISGIYEKPYYENSDNKELIVDLMEIQIIDGQAYLGVWTDSGWDFQEYKTD